MHQPTLQLCSLCVVPYFISMSEVTLLSSVGIKKLEIDRWNLGDEWRVSQSQREEEEEEEEHCSKNLRFITTKQIVTVSPG
jgi:hypothetical protein